MNLSSFLGLVGDAGATVSSLPLAAHILAGIGLVAGLLLWFMGRKVLKPIFCIFGALGGAWTGFFLMAHVGDTFFGVPSPYIGLAVGGLLGIGAAVMLFRFAVAISTGLALGLAGILIAATYLHFVPQHDPARDGPARQSLPGVAPLSLTGEQKKAVVQAAQSMAAEVKEFVSEKVQDLRDSWNGLSGHDQVVMGVSGLGAALAGFFLGLFMPVRSSAVATALFGSAVWLASAAWIITAASLPGHGHLNQTAVVWLVVWLVVATAGVALQIGTFRGRAAKAD
jgi:hypothetical protein